MTKTTEQINIKQRLLAEAQNDYKKFSASLIPNINNVLGVRLPILRKIAKEIYNSNHWENFVKSTNAEFMEETMLKGMIIGLIKDKPENILEFIKDFVPKINNWAVCDSFCTGLKFTIKNKKLVWDFIQPYFRSQEEYEIRFGVVMLLSYFIDEEYIDNVLKILDKLNHEGYYAKMAIAWAISVCFARHETITLSYLKKSKLDKWTYNKAIQKCIESFRVSNEMKTILKGMKK